MSSCQGEMVDQEFYVTAVDLNGNLLFNGTVTTLRNGFLELWLPRKRIIDLKVLGLDRSARGKITTFDASKTCLTTFQLQ